MLLFPAACVNSSTPRTFNVAPCFSRSPYPSPSPSFSLGMCGTDAAAMAGFYQRGNPWPEVSMRRFLTTVAAVEPQARQSRSRES